MYIHTYIHTYTRTHIHTHTYIYIYDLCGCKPLSLALREERWIRVFKTGFRGNIKAQEGCEWGVKKAPK